MRTASGDRTGPVPVPGAELRTADHILPASALDTRALFEGRGLVAVDITEFEKLEGA